MLYNLENPPFPLDTSFENEGDQKYWTCRGEDISELKKPWWAIFGFWKRLFPITEQWLIIYYTKEEAEAGSASASLIWEWDREPAIQVTLGEVLNEARVYGNAGVVLRKWKDNRWITLREYPANIPLI